MQRRSLISGAIGAVAMHLGAQTHETFDLADIGMGGRWKVSGRAISMVEVKGKRALKMDAGANSASGSAERSACG